LATTEKLPEFHLTLQLCHRQQQGHSCKANALSLLMRLHKFSGEEKREKLRLGCVLGPEWMVMGKQRKNNTLFKGFVLGVSHRKKITKKQY